MVSLPGTAVSVSTTPSNPQANQAVTYTATVTRPTGGTSAPTGTVNFYDGQTYLGQGSVTLVNGWDWLIIAFYPLLPIGAALLAAGLWRSRRLRKTTVVLLAGPLFVLIAPPLCPPSALLGVALAAGFVLFLRDTSSPPAT